MATVTERTSFANGDLFPLSETEINSLEGIRNEQAQLRKEMLEELATIGQSKQFRLTGDIEQLDLPLLLGEENQRLLFPVLSTVLPESFNVSTLDGQQAFSEQEAEAFAREMDLRAAFEASDEETYAVLHNNIADVHGAVLESSLAALRTRGNAEEKTRILEWIFAPDIFGWMDEVGEVVFYEDVEPEDRALYAEVGWKVLWEVDRQLSYQHCCKIFGYNPEFFQEFLERVLSERGIAIAI